MINIYIDNQLVDLDSTNISLQKEFQNEAENIRTDVEYSYTISLPTSIRNREIFGFTETFDVVNKFSRLYNAELYVDESLILSGKFKLTSIDSQHYKGNIYNPKKTTISDILGDRMLNEIDPHLKPMTSLSDFDKINNMVTKYPVEVSRLPYEWESVEGVWDNHVLFPYVLYGLPMNIPEENPELDIYTQNLLVDKHSITSDNIFPAFNVLSVIKDMFKTEGYKITGNIFEGGYKNFFEDLYQTYQGSYQDYVDKKEVPYYLEFEGKYTNFDHNAYQIHKEYPAMGTNGISSSLQVIDAWTEDSFDIYANSLDGNFKYGVDNPFRCNYINHQMNIIEDTRTMWVSSGGEGIIVIPKSGWYRINCKGSMVYPFNGEAIFEEENRDVAVGGTKDERDCTDLSEMPFEFQIKKGTQAENPRLYSFNTFLPCMATDYVQRKSVICDGGSGEDTYIEMKENDSRRRYGKNGKTTYVYNYSSEPTTDFICGVRLGGALFSTNAWWAPIVGAPRRPNRYMLKGAGLALPRTDITPTTKILNEYRPEWQYADKEQKNITGTYLLLNHCEGDNVRMYDYGSETAQVLVRKDANSINSSYSNFEGYNQFNNTSWDTTSNYGAVSYEGMDSSSASTRGNNYGEWDINTCVWLEKGDTVYIEILMPLHYNGHKLITPPRWVSEGETVNVTNVDYKFKIGFVNNNKDWKPRPDDGVKSWNDIMMTHLTNVNQFLPSVKCNDYLEKFLKTFNLQLTMQDAKTFRIDTSADLDAFGNVIDIDGFANITDAEFKPLSSPSTRQLGWKIDQNETGYAQGNQSPYATWLDKWDYSGYTGSITINNDTNSSGSIKKNESQWSYAWYKDIKFINNPLYMPIGHTESVMVISDKDQWKDGMSFALVDNETPQTSKTSRLFFLNYNTTSLTPIITFENKRYEGGYERLPELINLVLPRNALQSSNDFHGWIYLDYAKNIRNEVNSPYYKENNKGLTEVFFNTTMQTGYDIEVPVKLSNQDYADTNATTLYKLNDGLYRIKSITHDVDGTDLDTVTMTTLN